MSEHYYLSTACLHQQHGQCRASCKFCAIGCICPCHHKPAADNVTQLPVRDIIREHLQRSAEARVA